MNVRVERDGPVSTVILDRPSVRNAVDGPTAAALADAFRQFEADDTARAAVLYGAGGTFCAGADLKAVGGPDGNRARPDGAEMEPPAFVGGAAAEAVEGGIERLLLPVVGMIVAAGRVRLPDFDQGVVQRRAIAVEYPALDRDPFSGRGIGHEHLMTLMG